MASSMHLVSQPLCPPGAGANWTTLPSTAVCHRCPRGTVAPSGYSGCLDCPPGKYADAIGGTDCTPCRPGTANAESGAPSAAACEPCAGGTWSVAAAAQCQACPAGHWSLPGAATCATCWPGTFAAASGGASCTNCTAGTYSGAVGATSSDTCVPCPRSSWSRSGATACLPCRSGTDSAVGSAACTPDPPGLLRIVVHSTEIVAAAAVAVVVVLGALALDRAYKAQRRRHLAVVWALMAVYHVVGDVSYAVSLYHRAQLAQAPASGGSGGGSGGARGGHTHGTATLADAVAGNGTYGPNTSPGDLGSAATAPSVWLGLAIAYTMLTTVPLLANAAIVMRFMSLRLHADATFLAWRLKHGSVALAVAALGTVKPSALALLTCRVCGIGALSAPPPRPDHRTWLSTRSLVAAVIEDAPQLACLLLARCVACALQPHKSYRKAVADAHAGDVNAHTPRYACALGGQLGSGWRFPGRACHAHVLHLKRRLVAAHRVQAGGGVRAAQGSGDRRLEGQRWRAQHGVRAVACKAKCRSRERGWQTCEQWCKQPAIAGACAGVQWAAARESGPCTARGR